MITQELLQPQTFQNTKQKEATDEESILPVKLGGGGVI
jgi:hypothetical protein